MVEVLLEQKVTALPHPRHWRDGGKVVIFFRIDAGGRTGATQLVLKSAFDDINRFAVGVVRDITLPTPPPLKHGLYWTVTFDGADMPGKALQLR